MKGLRKDQILILMLEKFPEVKKVSHKITWVPTDTVDTFGLPSELPNELQEQIVDWFYKLQVEFESKNK